MQSRSARRFDLVLSSFLVIATVALSLFTARGRIMWSDELFGWMLVSDPSFHHMVRAWEAGADGGGIVFYLCARGWLALLGHSAAAFRAFSATAVGLAAAFTFLTARRFFRREIAYLAVATVWFSSDVVLWQNLQGRFYGLLLAGVAAACLLCVLTWERLTPGRLLLTFLVHLCLVGAHPFGLIYSAAVLLATVCADVARRKFQPGLYAAIVGGWSILVPSLTAMRNTAAVGKPHFWTVRPGLSGLGDAYSSWSLVVSIVLAGLTTLLVARLLLRQVTWKGMCRSLRRQGPLPWLMAGLLAVPLAVFAVSQTGTSFFVDRYLLPCVVGSCFLICQLMTFVIEGPDGSVRSGSMARYGLWVSEALLVPLLFWTAAFQFPSYWVYPVRDPYAPLLSALPAGVPVCVEPVDVFDELLAYHRSAFEFVYLLDGENASDPNSPRGEVSGFHEMANWKKVGYFSGAIQNWDAFLSAHDTFAFVDAPGYMWLDKRILQNPDFNVRALPIAQGSNTAAKDLRIWLVQRRTPNLRRPVP